VSPGNSGVAMTIPLHPIRYLDEIWKDTGPEQVFNGFDSREPELLHQ
jgi:hypothetical protein